ncbi:hypothetical protein BVI1335_2380011 [Burkholderia vietnamiensis]|nr:hypothetical protein BVI1335_2380011 [Burkholderia vietnamiensis]
MIIQLTRHLDNSTTFFTMMALSLVSLYTRGLQRRFSQATPNYIHTHSLNKDY